MKIDGRTLRHKAKSDEILRLFAELGSTRLVADRLGMRTATVGNLLKRHGVATPRTGRRNPHSACERNAETVLRMCEEGCSLSEIGRTVGTKNEEVKKFLRRNGVAKEFPTYAVGERHYAWKGRLVDKNGYVLIHCKGHPNARKHTHYVFEHRLVVEESLGRYLLPTEVVHHINGVRDDNRLENLQVFQSNADHLAVDLKGRCPKWTPEGKERIRRALLQRWSAWRSANQKA
jgi:DNA-binding CsgD family transcriptional regulator